MTRRGLLLGGTAAAAALVVGLSMRRAFATVMAAAKARVASGSKIFAGRFGRMEYAIAGEGPPLIMIHGTGGGFDQGLAFARPLCENGFRIISPSRFGYLRTDMPDDPSSENQADAIVELMDHLGIDQAPVVGGSAGALSAIQVAIRHPDRCSALVALVPATYVPGRAPVRRNATGAAIMAYGLQSDFLFWCGMTLFEDSMIRTLLATDPDLVAKASPAEQTRVRAILRNILPVSDRAVGLLNDGKLAGNPAPMALETITAPTLAISLEDDRFGTFEAARHIADTVTGARLVSYPTGGHVYVGHESDVMTAITDFLSGR
jgi:2-hydroxy-6-oxonona-2,4-dienedioate hydrolase